MIDLKQFEGHTPGPWTDDICTFAPDKKPIMVCTDYAHEFGEGGPEARANARLIAAAPDLLAELTRLRAELEKARGAIASAADKLELMPAYSTPLAILRAALAPAASGEKEHEWVYCPLCETKFPAPAAKEEQNER